MFPVTVKVLAIVAEPLTFKSSNPIASSIRLPDTVKSPLIKASPLNVESPPMVKSSETIKSVTTFKEVIEEILFDTIISLTVALITFIVFVVNTLIVAPVSTLRETLAPAPPTTRRVLA